MLSATIPEIGKDWKKYTATLKTGDVKETADARFVISTAGDKTGSVWFNLVSLFPPTYHDQPNGFRIDLMEKLAELKPSFLRFPGGNYLEGPDYDNRFNWKITIGPLEERPGHQCPWGYRSSDGLGLLEFLMWCEDLKMEPVLAVYAGSAHRRRAQHRHRRCTQAARARRPGRNRIRDRRHRHDLGCAAGKRWASRSRSS